MVLLCPTTMLVCGVCEGGAAGVRRGGTFSGQVSCVNRRVQQRCSPPSSLLGHLHGAFRVLPQYSFLHFLCLSNKSHLCQAEACRKEIEARCWCAIVHTCLWQEEVVCACSSSTLFRYSSSLGKGQR